MHHKGLSDFMKHAPQVLARGPVAIVLVEDDVEVASTLRHNLQIGFHTVLVFMPDAFDLPAEIAERVHRITYDMTVPAAMETAVNTVLTASPGMWMYYCFNAEYLFHPFCESRTVGEMLAFHSEERRHSMLTYVVDLYADNLQDHPNAVSLERAHLDRSGYYALARNDPANHNHAKERQLDFFGGLRWRYE